jgi:Fe-S-cluster containining protein
MCCDGSLHATVGVSEERDDTAALEAVGFQVTRTDGILEQVLPCPAHSGDHCRIYSHRPGACRDFRCLTLQRYESGQMSRNEALDVVRDALALRAEVRRLVVEAGGPEDLRRLVDVETHLATVADADQVELTARYADALLALAHLLRFLGDHFVETAGLKEERA